MSEEIGKKVAEMLLKDTPSISSGISDQERFSHLLNSLRNDVRTAAQGLNKQVGSHLLSVVDREYGFQFNFRNQLTLIVDVSPSLVTLKPSRSNAENPAASKFVVFTEDEGYEFKGVPANPAIQTWPMKQELFIEGIIKVACNKHFDSK